MLQVFKVKAHGRWAASKYAWTLNDRTSAAPAGRRQDQTLGRRGSLRPNREGIAEANVQAAPEAPHNSVRLTPLRWPSARGAYSFLAMANPFVQAVMRAFKGKLPKTVEPSSVSSEGAGQKRDVKSAAAHVPRPNEDADKKPK